MAEIVAVAIVVLLTVLLIVTAPDEDKYDDKEDKDE